MIWTKKSIVVVIKQRIPKHLSKRDVFLYRKVKKKKIDIIPYIIKSTILNIMNLYRTLQSSTQKTILRISNIAIFITGIVALIEYYLENIGDNFN